MKLRKGKKLVESWFVYLLRCADGSLYTGISTDVPRRLEQHNAGTASRYTRSRLPTVLVYQETQASRSLALKRELAIKALSRQAKEALIRSAELPVLKNISGRLLWAGPKRVKWKESARVATLVAAKPNQCFTNCYRVIKRVEGYKAAMLVRSTVTLQTADDTCEEPHVWIEMGGWIIDPTLIVVREKGDKCIFKTIRKFSKLPKVARLFGGLVPQGDFYGD